jgi:taurine transport system substrate-binding protein
VPFVSTSHFHALVALQNAGVNPADVKIVNLRPPEVAAAWQRGDIDATYIWDPVLAQVKKSGKVLIDLGAGGQATGKATFDGFVVDRGFAKENGDFVARSCRCWPPPTPITARIAPPGTPPRRRCRPWRRSRARIRTKCPRASRSTHSRRPPSRPRRLAGRRRAVGRGAIAARHGVLPQAQGTIQNVLPDYSVGVDPRSCSGRRALIARRGRAYAREGGEHERAGIRN